MDKTRLASLLAGAALAATAVACSDNANHNTANSNTHGNSNVAVVTNNNGNANTAGITTTNNNANANTGGGRYNANITREEYERDKDRYGREAKDAGDKVGATAGDGWLWVKAKAALATVDDLPDTGINVDVENGVVTLRGNVESQKHVTDADKAIKALDDVKSVKNMLKVGAGGGGGNSNNGNANRRG